MKLVVGAPVADRDWALPRWFEGLASQTRQPDEYCFVLSTRQPTPPAATIRLIRDLCPVDVPQLSYAMDGTPFVPRIERNFHPKEQVFGDFARRRNLLLRMVLKRQPDVFLSLDTDVMLHDPSIIAQLLGVLRDADLAAPCLFLHPAGRESECYNAGWWQPIGDGPERPWRRATAEDAAKGLQLVDIPMAAVMMRSEVAASCRYRYHAQGEDCGFAQDLDRLGFRTLWNPNLVLRHVMSPDAL